jgi:RHS repeat-associated protein
MMAEQKMRGSSQQALLLARALDLSGDGYTADLKPKARILPGSLRRRPAAVTGRNLSLLGALLILSLGFSATTAEANVGATGAFETTVAIKIPAFHGLAPRLGLVYSSSSQNGWIGRGWSLTGLSTIRRISVGRGLPRWDGSDTFALDGRDLILCPPVGSSGAVAQSPSCAHRLTSSVSGAPYTTARVEGYQRIMRTPPSIGTHARPAEWFVWRTDGVKATYDPGLVTSRGVLEWRLTNVQDLSGNVVSYDWSPAKGSQVSLLQAIRYGDVEIRFVSAARRDPITVATGDGVVTNGFRLQAIDETASDHRIRAYAVNYALRDQASRQSFIQSVQQYGSNAVIDATGVVHGPTALPATTFSTQVSGNSANWKVRSTVGVADWAVGWPSGPDDSTRFSTRLNGAPQGIVSVPPGGWGQWTALDLNADLRTDFVLVAPTDDQQVDIHIELTQPEGGYVGLFEQFAWPDPDLSRRDTFDIRVADVNGDGIKDLVVGRLLLAATLFGQDVRLGTPFRWSPPQPAPGFTRQYGAELLGDISGDGRADVVELGSRIYPDCRDAVSWMILDGSGQFETSRTSSTCWPAPATADAPSPHYQLADLNGDLRADVAGFREAYTDQLGKLVDKASILTAIAGTQGFHTRVQHLDRDWRETTDETIVRCGGSAGAPCERETVNKLPTFWSDVDGDGRSDLVVFRPGPNGKKGANGTRAERKVFAWTFYSRGDGSFGGPTEGTTPFTNSDLQSITLLDGHGQVAVHPRDLRWLQGDFNGDGIGDFARLVRDKTGTKETTLRAVSDRHGNWTSSAAESTLLSCFDACSVAATQTGDVNGDGQDDMLFTLDTSGGEFGYWALAVDVTPAAPAAVNALSGDVNADGRQDLLYPTLTSSGVQVRVFQQREDHSYKAVDPVTVNLPGKVAPHLARHAWRIVDVNCDGRADLVNLDYQITVLLAVGDHEWQPVTSPRLPAGGLWSLADVKGRGCDALVHVGQGDGAKAGVTVMFGQADGTWVQEFSPAGGSLRDALNWHLADVDGNGQADLVYVNGQTGQIETLLRRERGWQAIPSQVALSPTVPPPFGTTGNNILAGPLRVSDLFSGGLASPSAPQAGVLDLPWSAAFILRTRNEPIWRAVDVNGDGSADLVRVSVGDEGWLLVETLLSHGDGRYSARTESVAAVTKERGGPPGPEADADAQNWLPANIDHNGRTDLVRVFNDGDQLVIQVALSRANGGWDLKSWPGDATRALPASSAWRVGDLSGTGETSAERVDDVDGRLTVSGFKSEAPRELINEIANGLGATTTVDYDPGTSMVDADATTPEDCRQPAGASAAPVVTSLTTADGPTHTTDRSTTRYRCPRFSWELRSTIAWKETWTTHEAATNRPASSEHVVRDVFPSGIAQPVLDEVRDAGDALIRVTASHYEPVGDEPQTDLLKSEAVSTCAEGKCATSTVELAHDEFGNITSEFEQAAGSRRQRRTEVKYLYEHAWWLEGLPRLTRIFDPTQTDLLVRATLVCYDNDTSLECDHPPAPCPLTGACAQPRGLATLTRVWDNISNSYVVADRAGYDRFGNQVSTSDAKDDTTTTFYDRALHLYPVEVCNALRQCSTQPPPWDRRADAPLTAVDANQAKTVYTYDPLGRPKTTTLPRGALTTTNYETDADRGTVTTSTTTAPTAPQVSLWARTYTDGLGRTYLTERPGDDVDKPIAEGTRVVRIETRYSDSSARPEAAAAPHFLDEPAVWDSFGYDAAGRQVSQTHADRSTTSRSYLIDDAGLTVVKDEDEKLRTQTHKLDGWGALREAALPSVVGGKVVAGANAETTYSYDVSGNPLTITDAAGNIVTNLFDTLGRKRTEDDPDRDITRYDYDAAGNLHTQTDARGRVLTYGYDKLNRRISKTDSATIAVTNWVYDQPNHGASVGRLTSETGGPTAAGCAQSVTHSWSYNSSGEITHETVCIRGVTRSFSRHYDPLGRQDTLTYPDGEKIIDTYNPAGQLNTIPGYVLEMHYNAADQPISARYANGTRGSWHYEPSRGWLDTQSVLNRAGHTLFAGHYPHDPNGSLKGVNSESNGTAETYGYDPLGRLTTVTGSWQQDLTYDDIGNLTTNSRRGTYHYPPHRECTGQGAQQVCAGPHAVTSVGASSYEYDATGNMTTVRTNDRIVRQLTWNSDGLLTSVTDSKAGRIDNQYDADGHRVEQTSRAGVIRYFGLADLSRSTGLTKYIFAGSQLVARHRGSVRTWYTLDRLGSPRLLTRQDGRVAARENYAPYGQTINGPETADTIGYTGRNSIGETGLIDMLARAYDPALARMLSADSIIPNPADPQNLNRYTYADNNPVFYTDPSGHEEKPADTPAADNTDSVFDYLATFDSLTVSHEQLEQAWLHPGIDPNSVLCSGDNQTSEQREPVPVATEETSSSATTGSGPQIALRPAGSTSGAGASGNAGADPTPNDANGVQTACQHCTLFGPAESTGGDDTDAPSNGLSEQPSATAPTWIEQNAARILSMAALIPLFTYKGVHIEIGPASSPQFLDNFKSYVLQQWEYESTDAGHLEKLTNALRNLSNSVNSGGAPREWLSEASSDADPIYQRAFLQGAIGGGGAFASFMRSAATAVKWTGGVAAAGLFGYAVGTLINQHLSEETQNAIGGTINEIVNDGR